MPNGANVALRDGAPGAMGSTVTFRIKSFLPISYPPSPTYSKNVEVSINKIRGYSKVFNQGNQCCFQR